MVDVNVQYSDGCLLLEQEGLGGRTTQQESIGNNKRYICRGA